VPGSRYLIRRNRTRCWPFGARLVVPADVVVPGFRTTRGARLSYHTRGQACGHLVVPGLQCQPSRCQPFGTNHRPVPANVVPSFHTIWSCQIFDTRSRSRVASLPKLADSARTESHFATP